MDKLVETITKINDVVNDFVWVKIGLILLIGTGVLLTCCTKFFQVSHIGHWWKSTIGSVFKKGAASTKKTDKQTISQFQALCTALAATIGTGNIAGVAAAIVIGGPGAVFWMWIAAFFGMMTNILKMFWESFIGGVTAKANGPAVPCITWRTDWARRSTIKRLVKFLGFCFLFACFLPPLA